MGRPRRLARHRAARPLHVARDAPRRTSGPDRRRLPGAPRGRRRRTSPLRSQDHVAGGDRGPQPVRLGARRSTSPSPATSATASPSTPATRRGGSVRDVGRRRARRHRAGARRARPRRERRAVDLDRPGRPDEPHRDERQRHGRARLERRRRRGRLRRLPQPGHRRRLRQWIGTTRRDAASPTPASRTAASLLRRRPRARCGRQRGRRPRTRRSALPHLSIGWANLQWPPTIDDHPGSDRTDNVYGQVYVAGLTDAGAPASAIVRPGRLRD